MLLDKTSRSAERIYCEKFGQNQQSKSVSGKWTFFRMNETISPGRKEKKERSQGNHLRFVCAGRLGADHGFQKRCSAP